MGYLVTMAQGQEPVAKLLAGTLAVASQANATCYLETFTPRRLRFYERMGILPGRGTR
jgi:hypothetical protein